VPLLLLQGITKRFGAVPALESVDLAVEPGEIHALLGENGAGKSTLMRIAYGLIRPDRGEIRIDGTLRRIRSAVDARRLGIGMVHQHFSSITAFTVSENVALSAGWRGRPAVLRTKARELAEAAGLDLDPDALTSNLSAGLKQRLEVLKALAGEARLLLLDEPSSVLAPSEARSLLGRLSALRQRGIASVLITHKLDEALAVADRVTVLRRGRAVFTGPVAGVTATSLASYMLGEVAPSAPSRASFPTVQPGPAKVLARDLAVARLRTSGPGLISATFELRAGEVLGLAAVEGNGQRELLRAIAGLAQPAGGTLEVQGRVCLVPEDRTSEGLIGELSLAQNLALSQGASAPWLRRRWIDWESVNRRCQALLEAYQIRATGPGAEARSLSGGNQQRVVIAAALERQPAVLVAENPTRGLDVRATADVLARLRDAARSGVAVIVHSADLDELHEVADRIAVVSNGRYRDLAPASDREAIGRAMLGEGAAW
jgi:general nucleoside transport system ATP-binding protein